ncbi:hypothetical protein DFP72DRAFT_521399 [Ephemerocybe angulata]|uniref:Uncharacterized protein n=1 Tax=Ephemerocybe angulata TaxID=980116 RepID=A0A8H6ICK1_9AGAR|nr:hypothetical protein DFP72DRAFT_521399 [Tulosesus angulatus]
MIISCFISIPIPSVGRGMPLDYYYYLLPVLSLPTTYLCIFCPSRPSMVFVSIVSSSFSFFSLRFLVGVGSFRLHGLRPRLAFVHPLPCFLPSFHPSFAAAIAALAFVFFTEDRLGSTQLGCMMESSEWNGAGVGWRESMASGGLRTVVWLLHIDGWMANAPLYYLFHIFSSFLSILFYHNKYAGSGTPASIQPSYYLSMQYATPNPPSQLSV